MLYPLVVAEAARAGARARSRAAIAATRDRRLRSLCRHAHDHVAYYETIIRSVGLRRNEIATAEQLSALPTLSPDDFEELHELFFADNPSVFTSECELAGLAPSRLVTAHSPAAVLSHFARLQALLPRFGVDLREFRPFASNGLAVVDGRPEPGVLQARGCPQPVWRLSKVERLALSEWSDRGPDELHDEMCRLRPLVMIGRPSTLALLADRIARRGSIEQGPCHPRLVVAVEEPLSPRALAGLRAVFRCHVIEAYCRPEVGLVGFECQAGQGLHVEEDAVLVEVLRDGEPAKPGEEGEIVVTDLLNRTTPIIRLCTGETGRLSAEPCRCGLAYPLLLDLRRRSDSGGGHASRMPALATAAAS